jgi:dolichol-phosphate mannosyltransferase
LRVFASINRIFTPEAFPAAGTVDERREPHGERTFAPLSAQTAPPVPLPRTVVIVPTSTEASNIASVIEQVLALDPALSVLVVDDASADGTPALVRAAAERQPGRVDLLERPGKLGLGTAYLAGFRRALAADFELVCEMDADLSHQPSDLPALVDAVASGRADLAVGSRYLDGVRVINWPLSRLFLSYGAGIYTRLITRIPVRDVTSGFKCFHRRVLEAIPLERVTSNGYSFQIEMSYRTWKAGFRIVEVPIVFIERSEGQSKMSRAIVREAAWKVWELRLLSLLGRL